MAEVVRVELTETEVRDAIAEAAAKKAEIYGKLIRFKVELEGVWVRTNGRDDVAATVSIEVVEQEPDNDG